MEERLVQLDFTAAFDRVSHRCLLYKLTSIGVEGQFLSIVSEFLSDRRQHMPLDGKVSESADVVSGVPQGIILEPFLFILYTLELSRILGYHIMDYEDDTKIYAVLHSPLLRPQLMESLNQDLATIDFLCFKWHMKLNAKKTKSITVSRSRTYAANYNDLILGVPLNPKL